MRTKEEREAQWDRVAALLHEAGGLYVSQLARRLGCSRSHACSLLNVCVNTGRAQRERGGWGYIYRPAVEAR